MQVLKFQIRLHTGQTEQLTMEADRVLIGSGAHCEIRLPVDQARVEHVLIEAAPGGGLFARALNFEPPPTLNNVPFQQGPLPPGSVIGVGQCQIYVEVAEAAAGAGAKKQQKSSPMTLVLCTILIAAGGWYLVNDDGGGKGTPRPPKSNIELWDAPVAGCAYTGPQALAFARERMAVADAKRERRPFHVQDGVQAVPIYEQAGQCFRSGGDPASATLADESAKFLRHEMTDDFRTRKVRLEHALSIDDDVSAQKEVRILLQFTEGKSGDYVTWLSNLDRTLKLKIGAAKKS